MKKDTFYGGNLLPPGLVYQHSRRCNDEHSRIEREDERFSPRVSGSEFESGTCRLCVFALTLWV